MPWSLNAELKNILLICWFLDIRYSWHSCDMHRLHRPGKPISFFVKSKASTSCPSEHGFTPAEKGFKLQDIKIVTPRFLDEETPSCQIARINSMTMLLELCFLRAASFATWKETLPPSKHANTPNGWAWAARRPEGSLPGAVHHDLACVHRAGASVGSVSKAPALSPSNWSMEIFRRSKVSCYMLVSRRIS